MQSSTNSTFEIVNVNMREGVHKVYTNTSVLMSFNMKSFSHFQILARGDTEEFVIPVAVLVRVDVMPYPGHRIKHFFEEMNATLDNLALLCAMQRNLEYRVERRLVLKNLEETTKFNHLLQRR